MNAGTHRPRITELKMTTHAEARIRQRGVCVRILEAVLAFGDVYRAGEGCRAYYLGRQAAKKHASRLRGMTERARNVAIIVSADQAIVSVQHVRRPKRRWRRLRGIKVDPQRYNELSVSVLPFTYNSSLCNP